MWNIAGDYTLKRDTDWDGDILIGSNVTINLNGYTLRMGRATITSNSRIPNIQGAGSLTAYYADLEFQIQGDPKNGHVISSKITDDRSYRTGLRVSAVAPGRHNHVDLTGNESNTFTGDVHISNYGGLQLYKRNYAIAVRGDIYLTSGGYMMIAENGNQISDSSTIYLNSKARTSYLFLSNAYSNGNNISEYVCKLKVDGYGVMDYSCPVIGEKSGKFYFYLDDLEIADDSKLTIKNWNSGKDYLLVRKDSVHLYDALTRIKFEGHREWRADVKHYNKDYWQIIPGIPEPCTYGAIFGAMVLPLSLLRNRERRRLRRSPKHPPAPV